MAIIVILGIGKVVGILRIPDPSIDQCRKVKVQSFFSVDGYCSFVGVATSSFLHSQSSLWPGQYKEAQVRWTNAFLYVFLW